jgi:hypothetical protein
MLFNPKNFIITLLILMFTFNIAAQVSLSSSIDAGENNVSEGFFVKSSLWGSWQFDKIGIEGGSRFDLKSVGDNIFTAASLIVAREFMIREFQFEAQCLLIYNLFSEPIHESNWGILANIERKHFIFKLGMEFRNYHITKKGVKEYDIESNKSLHESWNLIYLLQYNLKPSDHKWNIGTSITNIDQFLINQETNPMINLKGRYKISSPLTLYFESWYMNAGSLNISAGYFGYFLRTGVIWSPGFIK